MPGEMCGEFPSAPIAHNETGELKGVGVLGDAAIEVGAGVVKPGLPDRGDGGGGVVAATAERIGETANGATEDLLERSFAGFDFFTLSLRRLDAKEGMV